MGPNLYIVGQCSGYNSKAIIDFLQSSGCNIIDQSSYSHGLNACDAFLFSWLKYEVRGMTFRYSNEGVAHAATWFKGLVRDVLKCELQSILYHGNDVVGAGGVYTNC